MGMPLALATSAILIGWVLSLFTLTNVMTILAIDLPFIIAFWWVYHQRVYLASLFPPAICFGLALYFTYTSDIVSSGLLFSMIAILLSAMLQGVKAQWLVAVSSVAGHLLIGILRYPYPAVEFVAYGIMITAAFAGTALLIGFYIQQLRSAYAIARASEERIQNLFERVPVGLYRSTPDGRILDANQAMVEMLRYPDLESLLATSADSLYMNSRERDRENAQLERDGTVHYFQLQLRCYDGSPIWVRDTARVIRDGGGNVLFYEGSLEDITEKKQAEERLRFLATHDPLTNLPNRTLLYDRLKNALERAHRNRRNRNGKHHVAVMLLDMDNFKEVNDTLGHAFGDLVLQAAAEKLVECMRTSDTVARVGGDEFTLVAGELSSPEDAVLVAQKIVDAVSEPFWLEGRKISLGVSIGISLYPEDGETIETLLKNADIAMYQAKEKHNCYQLYAEGEAL
jgi:diguanylate cyclase (GGDEF)-like protein/PAS domain S-box-containing protein